MVRLSAAAAIALLHRDGIVSDRKKFYGLHLEEKLTFCKRGGRPQALKTKRRRLFRREAIGAGR